MLPAIGLAIREQNRSCLEDSSITAAEITVDRACQPLKFDNYLRPNEFDFVGVYARELCVATTEPLCRSCLEGLKVIAERNGAHGISARLQSPRLGAGQAATPLRRATDADVVCGNVDSLQRFFGRTRFYLENTVEGTLTSEGLSRVLERTGCGWLLDVTSVYVAASNAGYDPYDFIAEVIPFATRVQIHLSGSSKDDRSGAHRDSHTQAIPEPVWSLYRHALVLGGHKTAAVLIERDGNFPTLEGWRNEVLHARFIAERVTARQRMLHGGALARRA